MVSEGSRGMKVLTGKSLYKKVSLFVVSLVFAVSGFAAIAPQFFDQVAQAIAPTTNVYFKQGAGTIPSGTVLNGSATTSNIQLVWDATGTDAYKTEISYPDTTTTTKWTGTKNLWIGQTLYTNNSFGQKGEGFYSYRVIARSETTGLWSDWSDTITLGYDTTKPTAAFTGTTSNPTPNGAYNSDFNVEYLVQDNVMLKSVNVALFDTDSSHSNHWVANCYNSSSVSSDIAAGTCTVHIPVSTPDGTYYVQIGGQDMAGYWTVAARRTITIDRTTPVAPTGGLPMTANTNDFNFTWNPVVDSGSPIVEYQYQTSQNSSEVGGVLQSGLWKNWVSGNAEQILLTAPLIHSVGAPDATTWYWQVRAIDAAGNVGPWSDIWNTVIDTSAPILTVNDSTGTNTTPTITGTTDGATDVVKVNGVDVGTLSVNGGGTYDWSYTLPTQSVGIHTITVTSTDIADNTTTETATVTIEQAPVTPTTRSTTTTSSTIQTTAPLTTQTAGTNLNDGEGTVADTAGQVLGDQTSKTDSSDKGTVKGESTTKNSNDPWSLLGLAWYWWLAIIATAGGIIWWLLAGYRQRGEN